MSQETKIQRYVCTSCNQVIPTVLNESTSSIEPQTQTCPNCSSNSIVLTVETKQADNRQILYS